MLKTLKSRQQNIAPRKRNNFYNRKNKLYGDTNITCLIKHSLLVFNHS